MITDDLSIYDRSKDSESFIGSESTEKELKEDYYEMFNDN